MTVHDRIRAKQIERQAEGYLELGMAQNALDTLNRLGANLSAHGLYLQGEAFRALEQYEEALIPLTKAAQKLPQVIHIWLALGWCHKRIGRLDLAIRDMEQGLAVQAEEALLHYNLACYLSLAFQRRRALQHLSRAFSIDASYRALVDSEPDFDPLRCDPQFQAITRAKPSPA